MPSTEATALSWIKKIPRSLFLADKIPLVGNVPPIPLEQWILALKTSLGLQNLAIKTTIPDWKEESDFFQGIPNKKVFAFSVPGIAGAFFLSFPLDPFADLSARLLTGDEKSVKDIEPSVVDGFVSFLVTEALYTLQKSGMSDKLMPVLLETLPPLPKDAGLVVNADVTINDKTIPCRLIFTKEFQESLSEEFKPDLQELYLKAPTSEKIDIPVIFEAARLKLGLKEFKSISPGDFLVLKNCSIDPATKAGPILLKVFDLPFFSGQLADGKITLAEVAQYYEAEANMQSDEHKDSEEEFDPEGEELSEFEDDLAEFSEEELEELDHAKEEAASQEPISEEDPQEHPEGEPQTVAAKETEAQALPAVTEKAVSEKAAPKTAKDLIAAGDIPLSLSVELGRVNISLNKLVELAPGNMLEVQSVGDSVDLVLNGRKVAEGELLKIGDVFGIRILDIGH